MEVFSVGHSNLDLNAFSSTLERFGVRTVADVRRVPRSRKWPHFDTAALAASLPERGIAYVHIPGLAGWRSGRADSPNGAWRNASFRAYADHAMTEDFAMALEDLTERAAREPTAMMCAEALWWRCHRRLIADRLVANGWEVLHIGSGPRAEPHQLPEFARVLPDGVVTYPA